MKSIVKPRNPSLESGTRQGCAEGLIGMRSRPARMRVPFVLLFASLAICTGLVTIAAIRLT